MDKYFDICIEEAKKSILHDDVPIGAVLVCDEKIVARGHNTRELEDSILGHAEINAILEASKALRRWNLSDCTLFVTLEPCNMCKEVIKQSKIANVYYLLPKLVYKKDYYKTDFKHHSSKNEQMYASFLSDFFKKKR